MKWLTGQTTLYFIPWQFFFFSCISFGLPGDLATQVHGPLNLNQSPESTLNRVGHRVFFRYLWGATKAIFEFPSFLSCYLDFDLVSQAMYWLPRNLGTTALRLCLYNKRAFFICAGLPLNLNIIPVDRCGALQATVGHLFWSCSIINYFFERNDK